MKRVIIDYKKLTNDVLNLLVKKFPHGYSDSDIISFRNLKNEIVETVELRTNDAIYLVKIEEKLNQIINKYLEHV